MQIKTRYLTASIIGNLLEWYDFVLYAMFASILAKHFFNPADHTSALIQVFGIFAAGYLVRPIGAVIIGHFGDVRSRQKALLFSLTIAGFATACIAILPTYQTAGAWATALLFALRLLQGMSVAGEFGGSLIVLRELSFEGRPATICNLVLASALTGILLAVLTANAMSWIFSAKELNAWAWRIPFAFGLVLMLLGAKLRISMLNKVELPAINRVKFPLLKLFKTYKAKFIQGIGLLCLAGITSAMFSLFLVTYATNYLHFSLRQSLSFQLIVTASQVAAYLLAGPIVDRYRLYKKWCLYIFPVVMLLTYPLFLLLQHGYFIALFAYMLLAILFSFAQSPMFVLLLNLFPKEVRYTGLTLSHNVAFAIFTGLGPLIATWWISKSHDLMIPAYMLIISTGISFIAIVIILKNSKKLD